MKNFSKILSLVLTVSLLAMMMVSCGTEAPAISGSAPAQSSIVSVGSAPAKDSRPYIAVISKGFQHQFWQTVMAGSKDAAARYNVDMTFDGPPSESDINIQVDMLNVAMAKNPTAIALAALDTESVTAQLNDLKAKGIPVVGFDSGIPNAPDGTIQATASTDNENAGKLAAESMFADSAFQIALNKADPQSPVVIAVASQDATSASIIGRTVGYVNQMLADCETLFPGEVAITGHSKFAKTSVGKAAVEIFVIIPPSSSATDAQNAIQTLFNMEGLISIFATNEATVGGILAATTDGTDLDRTNGKYKDITVVGFDAGKAHKTAVKNRWFLGSITQDPYMIGYFAVELAYKAYKGEPVEDYDTGCKFYNSENMDQPAIEQLLYD